MMLKSNQLFAFVLIFNLAMIGEAQSGVGNCDIVADDEDDYRACLEQPLVMELIALVAFVEKKLTQL